MGCRWEEHTPAHLYDLNDSHYGFDGRSCLGGDNWGDCDYDSDS
jgi:hypothetical protein